MRMTKNDSLAPATPAASDRMELIQTFVRIVQAGSLSAAAAQLGTTQPTISRRLQLLERSLGVRLLQRSTHAMKLTEDGERCFERAKDLLAGWEAFEADLRGVGVEAEGSLRVIVPHAFGQAQLIGPLAKFMHRHPKVTLHLPGHRGKLGTVWPTFVTSCATIRWWVGSTAAWTL
jgi:DNA-binding transcriptional LysR family regulator